MPPSLSRALRLALVLAVAILAAGWFISGSGSALASRGEPTRLLLVVHVSGAEDSFSTVHGRALTLLVKDLLEVRARRAVTLDPEAPAPGSSLKEGELLILRAYRRGTQLGLQADYSSIRSAGPPQILTCPAQSPAQALDWLLAQLPGPRGPADPKGRLLPRNDQAFWDLLEGMAQVARGTRLDEGLAFAARAESQAPGSAAAALLKGDLHFNIALASPRPSAQDLDAAQQGFREALRRWPGLPRAGMSLVRLLSDTGHPKEALEVARDLHRVSPRRGPTCSAILYAGRYTGLMDVVNQATEELESITLDPMRPQRLQLGQLYLSHWDAFERSLWTRPEEAYTAVPRFHLAYLRLLQGRREEAHSIFQELESHREAFSKYLRLGRVFRLALENRLDQARKELQPLDDESTGLAVPDGEFTFNLAEAWAFLGDQSAAVDAAIRALSQGFACTRWYEQSPLLREVQSLPRWRALVQTLSQRQQRLEARFPAEAFG